MKIIKNKIKRLNYLLLEWYDIVNKSETNSWIIGVESKAQIVQIITWRYVYVYINILIYHIYIYIYVI